MKSSTKFAVGVLVSLGVGLAASASSAAGNNIFMVNQATGGNYIPATPWVACGTGFCRTLLEPPRVVNLGALNATNTVNLQNDMTAQKAAYPITGYGPSQNINFNISFYQAINPGTSGGGQLGVDFTMQGGAALPPNLHWIQVVTDNYNITGINGNNLAAPMGPGNPENVIDAPGVASPYYDDAAAAMGFNATPPHFEDYSRRPEPTAANPIYVWNADLYLVANPAMNNVVVYNGVEWGWATYFIARLPEPDTWALMVLGIGGIGAVCRRERGRRLAHA